MMTAFSGHTFASQHAKSTEKIKQLEQAIQDSTHKLEEIRQKRVRAEEDIVRCTRESEQILDLIVEKGEIIDVLQQLGDLLQKERELSKELNDECSRNRNQKNDLQERTECITKKAISLAAELLEVKQCLAEAKTCNAAAQTLSDAPTSKSKRNLRKPK